MRWWLFVLSLLAAACGLDKYLPGGPVLDPWERSRDWSAPQLSGAAYVGPPRSDVPVVFLPFFGVTYDLDLVLVSRHPEWNMHEYAMLRTPNGPVWMAKDARESTMTQSIIAEMTDIYTLLPEVPLERKYTPVEVTDRSTGDWLDLEIAYENIDGKPVQVTYEGKPPQTMQAKRNGNTMGHSRDQAIVVLDVSHRDFGRKASVTIDGKSWGITRLLGIVPFQMVLAQTQGGFAIGELTQQPDETGFTTRHPGDITQGWTMHSGQGWLEARQTSELRTLTYRYLDTGDAWELHAISVAQWDRATPTAHVRFSPALPDPRRAFDAEHRSRFVIDINGQQNHAVGDIVMRSTDDQVEVELVPIAPDWTLDRPMTGSIQFGDEGRVDIRIARVPVFD